MTGIIAHRGASGLRPENTLAAFTKALEIGVSGIELDVQLSADGAVVVHHDLRLKPETTRDRAGRWLTRTGPPVCRLTVEELRGYDIGRLKPRTRYARRYPDQTPVDGERIPLLTDVIHLLQARGATETLWIELKTDPEQPDASSDAFGLAEAVAALLRARNFVERAILISFDWRGLMRAKEILPAARLGFLSIERRWSDNIRRSRPGTSPWTAGFHIGEFGGSLACMIKAAGGEFWSTYYRDLTPRRLAEAKEAGLRVNIWTLRRAADKPAFVARGADFLTTDRPDWFR